MAINMVLKDENTVIINDVVQVKDGEKGLEVKFLTKPDSNWVDGQTYGRIPAGAAAAFTPRRSLSTMASFPATQVSAPDRDALDTDPHYYQNGNNRLTVAESARRVVERVYWQTWGDYKDSQIGSPDDINKVARAIIRNNKGRDYAYTLAGRVKNLYSEKSFKHHTLAKLFELCALLDGAIQEPVLA